MPEMAIPTPRAIRPDKYRDPALLLPTHGVYPDFCREAFRFPACRSRHEGRYPYCFCQRSSNIRQLADRPHMPTLKPKPTQMFHPAF